MFSVGIIVPTWHYYANPFKLHPLNELYFATVIDSRFQGNGVCVEVIDLRQLRLQEKESLQEQIFSGIPEHDIYLYWIAKTADYMEILYIVKQLRTKYPESRHAAGGTHADNFPEECKKYFDAVVSGPGEESFINIINDCRSDSLKKEYKSAWPLVQFNDYPFPRRHYLPDSSVINTVLFDKYDGVPGTSALFSRGCNFKCAYCVYNVPDTIQRRSPSSVEDEIAYLKADYRIRGVNLRDEICIPMLRKVAVPFLEAMGHMDIIWRGQTRIGIDYEILKLARESGCVELSLGIESASQQVMDIVKKRQSVREAREFISWCKVLGIKVKMCLIIGLPGEPPDIVPLTKSLINETRPDYVNISGFCPVPGSSIFDNYEEYGIKYIDNDWSKHAHLLFRFSDEEHFGLPFEYRDEWRWGKNFSRTEIMNNIKEIQHYCQELGMCY